VTAQSYARMAQQHWQTFLPEATSKLPDPETHFRRLGERVETLVLARAESLISSATPRPTTEQEKVDLALWAHRTAEEEVLADEVFLTPEPDARENELPTSSDPTQSAPTSPETPTA